LVFVVKLIVAYLLQGAARERLLQSLLVVSEHFIGQLLERLQLIVFDVAARAFRKPVNEERSLSLPEQNDRTEASGLPFTWSRDSLFDDSAAEIRLNQAPPSPFSLPPRALHPCCAPSARSAQTICSERSSQSVFIVFVT
jgi:hypothetical protein